MDFNFKNQSRLKIQKYSSFPIEVNVTIMNRHSGFVKTCDKHVTIL